MEKPVFILGSHKSGTSLMRSLLDGTKELFVVPIEAHFFQHSGHWIDYALRRSPPRSHSFDELVKSFVRHIEHANRKSFERSKTSDSVLTGLWDVERFAEYLRTKGIRCFEKANFRGFLDSYIEAIHVSLYGNLPTTNRFVEKSVENAEFAALLKKLYPDAQFIHMLRNPYATLVSIRKHMTRGRYLFLGGIIAALNNSYYYLYKNPLVISEYKVVRYEDLVSRPQETMQNVSEFIEIEFTESLLVPTIMGRPWAGNSTSGQRFEGISTQPLAGWQKEIHPLEMALVNQLFSHVLRDFGYEKLEEKGSIYRPISGEYPKTYLANRWIWKLANRSRLVFS